MFKVKTQRQVEGVEKSSKKRSAATPLDEDRSDEMLSVGEVDLELDDGVGLRLARSGCISTNSG